MILLYMLMQVAEPAKLSLEPFYDEEVAATAFEKHLICLGTAAHGRRADTRSAREVAADIAGDCTAQAAELRKQLAEVYSRKTQLIPTGLTPSGAADVYVSKMNARAELVVTEDRKHK